MGTPSTSQEIARRQVRSVVLYIKPPLVMISLHAISGENQMICQWHVGHHQKKGKMKILQELRTIIGAGLQNLVSAEGINPVDESEIYSDDSDEDMVGGAYGGYAAELIDGEMPIDHKEYLSDDCTGSEFDYDYRNRFTPPTPPRPRLGRGETVYRVISHDDDLNMSAYFSDADPDEDWAKFDGVREIDKDNGYDSEDIYMSDDDLSTSDSANLANISNGAGDSLVCDTLGDTELDESSVTTPKVKSRKKMIIPPTLCKGYYGRNRFRRGHRHYVSSVIEYTVGSTLGASARKIPFYTLLMSAYKPNNRDKNKIHQEVFILCDMGASISLAPINVAEGLGMRVDRSELVSVRGADCKKIMVVGTSYVYMRDKASPSWRPVNVVITESWENFLLSCSDLKNFPEYKGKVKSGHANTEADIEEVMNEEIQDITTEGTNEGIIPHM